MPIEWPRFYTTALFDPAGQRQLRFIVLPDGDLGGRQESVKALMARLQLEAPRSLDPVEPWSLPFLIDAITRRGYTDYPLRFEIPWRVLPPNERGPSQFAQEAVYAPVLPVEASPVRGRSLASLIVPGGATSAIALYAHTGDPVVVLYAGGVTVLFTAAWPALLWLEAKVAELLGVELDQRFPEDEPDEEPPSHDT